MANKTFYIPQADRSMWAAAQRVADRKNTSLYRVLAEALRRDLPRAATEPTPGDEWADIASTAA